MVVVIDRLLVNVVCKLSFHQQIAVRLQALHFFIQHFRSNANSVSLFGQILNLRFFLVHKYTRRRDLGSGKAVVKLQNKLIEHFYGLLAALESLLVVLHRLVFQRIDVQGVQSLVE